MTTLNEYKDEAVKLAVYPDHGEGTMDAVSYATLGLSSEVGEICTAVKKVLRDDDGKVTESRMANLKEEIGDVLWYVANLANELDLDLDEIAELNIEKLLGRKSRNAIHGDDTNR